MIDINKKYRTRRGGEVKGLVDHKDHVLGWELFRGHSQPMRWDHKGNCAPWDGNPELFDLIEINEQEELLEEAKRRYTVGTRFKQYKHHKYTVVGMPFWDDGVIQVEVEDGNYLWIWNNEGLGDFGQWAEIVKEHTVEVYFYRGVESMLMATTHAEAPSPIAKKQITFYEGEGL